MMTSSRPDPMTSSYNECPVTRWEADGGDDDEEDDGPTLTMTLPPLLLQAGPHHHAPMTRYTSRSPDQHPAISSPSPTKITSPCPLCNINNNKVSILHIFMNLKKIIRNLKQIVSVLLSWMCHWWRLCPLQLLSLREVLWETAQILLTSERHQRQ